MASEKILVLGATGPSGICLLRELLFRKHNVVAYVRNPSKIPEDLVSSPLLEVLTSIIQSPSFLRKTMDIDHQRRNRRQRRPLTRYRQIFHRCLPPRAPSHA